MKIAHLADIHWKLKDRHDEYKEVMSNLYDQLRKDNPDTIVIAGDLVHSKTNMSPELVVEVREFLTSLSRISNVVIIPGNHDLNLSNVSRLDAISPCIPLSNNIKFFTKSGLYDDDSGKVVYGVWSCIDGKNVEIKEKNPDKTYIALFHGPIIGATMDNGYMLENVNASRVMFDDFDIAMLGDIHKYQTFRKDKTIAYAGSLIQQNHGESLDKGYLLWDIESKTHEFRKIKNDYGFYTVDFVDGKLPELDLPSKCRIRIMCEASDFSRVNELTSMANRMYNPYSVQVSFKAADRNKQEIGSLSKLDLKDGLVQKDILLDWLDKHSDENKQEILNLDKEIHNGIEIPEDDFSNTVWELKNVSIENFMSYGEKVVINFDSLIGIVGLFGDNAAGKSVVIDAILYALFNKITRMVKNEYLVNKRTSNNKCTVVVEIIVKGITYKIERCTSVKFKKSISELNGSKTTLKIHYVNENGDWESLTGVDKNESEKIIRNIIGTYDDFLTVTLSTQSSDNEFIGQRPAARTDNMMRFLGMDIFSKKHKLAKSRLNEVEWERKKINIEEESQTLDSLKNTVNIIDKEIIELDLKIVEHSNKLKENENFSNELNAALNREINIKENEDDIKDEYSKIQNEEKITKSSLSKLKDKYGLLKSIIKKTEDRFPINKDKLSELNDREIKLKTLKKQLIDFENNLLMSKAEFKTNNDFLSGKECPVSYDKNHLSCPFLAGVKEGKDKCLNISKEILLAEDEISKLKDSINIISKDTQALISHNVLSDIISKALYRLDVCQNSIVTLNGKLDFFKVSKTLLNGKIESIEKNKEIIERNKSIKNGLEKLRKVISIEKEELSETEKILLDKTIRLETTKKDMVETKNKIKNAKKLEKELRILSSYCSAMHRDGIPTLLLRKYISTMNHEINLVISDVVDFAVYFEMEDDSTDIKILMRYDGDIDDTRPAKLASGMEKLIINFAIRYALISIGTLSKPSSWFVDEGFGVCTNENLEKIECLFQNMKITFKNIIMITHIDSLKDISDHVINVTKVNNISKLTIG